MKESVVCWHHTRRGLQVQVVLGHTALCGRCQMIQSLRAPDALAQHRWENTYSSFVCVLPAGPARRSLRGLQVVFGHAALGGRRQMIRVRQGAQTKRGEAFGPEGCAPALLISVAGFLSATTKTGPTTASTASAATLVTVIPLDLYRCELQALREGHGCGLCDRLLCSRLSHLRNHVHGSMLSAHTQSQVRAYAQD
jgi:hypothetical protein